VVVEDVLCGVTVVGGGVAGICVVVVVEDVLCGVTVGGGGVAGVCVVVVVDCVLCAITGSDSASTTSDPKTTASSFLDFIRFSLCCPECDT
jgi:hypothetical protein